MSENNNIKAPSTFKIIDHKANFMVKEKVDEKWVQVEKTLKIIVTVSKTGFALQINNHSYYLSKFENLSELFTMELFKELSIKIQPNNKEYVIELINYIHNLNCLFIEKIKINQLVINEFLRGVK